MSSFSPIEPAPARGKLKVFLGYAAGVGKTYQMLEEAHKLVCEGRDLVVGYFEPHARADTMALMEGLETIPRKVVEYRGARFEEMDTGAILARKPQIAVVDEFPHTNVPGSPRLKRWEDVRVMLDAGIDVLTTMNVQHLESLNDQIYEITGVRVRETIPDWVLQQAAEVVMVDLTPRALLNRLERGVVYHGEKAQRAKENFFREETLVALRELALRQTAHEVEQRQPEEDAKPLEPEDSGERVLVYVTPDPAAAVLIRRGKRVADYMRGRCLAVAMPATEAEHDAIAKHLNFARNLHCDIHLLEGEDVAETLVSFAHKQGITQIYLLRSEVVRRIVRLARDMEVTVVAQRLPRPRA